MNKLDKNVVFLGGIFVLLISMQLVFFFNDFVNDAIQTQINNTLETRFGTYLFTIFLSKIMNNILFLWVVQSIFLLLCVLIFYKTLTIYFDKKTAFISSFLFMVAPYIVQLARQFLLHYVLHLFLFVISNYLLVKYIKTKDKKYSISYLVISCLGIFVNNYYLIAILSQCISLFFVGKKKVSIFALILVVVFQILNILVVRWILGYISSRDSLRFLSELSGFNNIFQYLIFKLNIYFKALGSYFFIFLLLIILINIKQVSKLFRKKYVLINFTATFVLTSSIFLYMDEHNYILPATRYFIFFSYWLAIIVGYLVKLSKSKFVSVIFYVIILFTVFSNVMECIEHNRIYIEDKEKGRVFEDIYQNTSNNYVVIYSDILTNANVWMPLSRYGFTDLFSLKSIPDTEITTLTKYMNETYTMEYGLTFSTEWILLTNGFEYNNFYIFSNNAKFSKDSRIMFTRDFMKSLKKNNQNFILVLKCCESDIEYYPMEDLRKSIVDNTTLYIYEN